MTAHYSALLYIKQNIPFFLVVSKQARIAVELKRFDNPILLPLSFSLSTMFSTFHLMFSFLLFGVTKWCIAVVPVFFLLRAHLMFLHQELAKESHGGIRTVLRRCVMMTWNSRW